MGPNKEEKIATLAPTKTLVAQYTKRDAMLYALGIGCCSDNSDKESYDRELRFVYENHPSFEPFPIFLPALSFVAEEQKADDGMHPKSPELGFGIRPFPPDSVANYLEDGTNCGPLPKEFFKNREDIEEVKDLPILHISQKLILHDEMKFSEQQAGSSTMIDPPMQIMLETKVLSVKPRSIGTFITTETKYYQGRDCIATSEMVALILGMDPDMAVPWEAKSNNSLERPQKTNNLAKSSSNSSTVADEKGVSMQKTVLQCTIQPNAALLYRLSGDYNTIHVDEDDLLLGSDDNNGDKTQKKRGAVLHGLCTMGHAVRAVLNHVDKYHHLDKSQKDSNEIKGVRLVSVQCNFVKPVFMGDVLHVEVWEAEGNSSIAEGALNVCFRVYRDHCCNGDYAKKQGGSKNERYDLVVDRGKAQFCSRTLRTKHARALSRL